MKKLETEQIVTAHLAGAKKRSITTPWGTVGFRKQSARLVVEDESEVILQVEMKNLPDNICKETRRLDINKTALNDHWKSTGEIPEGCTLQPEQDRFFVK